MSVDLLQRSNAAARRNEPPLSPANAEDDSGRGEIRAGILTLLVFFFGFGGWAAFAPLDAAVVAPGVVVVSGNRQTVQHRDGGIVTALLVKEGDRVNHGQVLIELGSPELVAQERALLSQVVDLQMQRARLTAERTGSRALERPPEWAALSPEDLAVAEAAYERHQREVAGGGRGSWSPFDARIVGYRGEIASINRQESLLQEELAGMRELAAEQLVPMTRVRQLERGLAELQGRRSELTAMIASTQQERHQDLRTVDARLAELTPQLAGARERLELTRLRAPADGQVVGLQVHTVGGVISPGQRVLDIVPEGQELIIEAQVRPEDADDLAAGQRTEVRITSFGGRNLPIVHGEVRQVSADRFTDERDGRAYFLTQIAVPHAEIDRLTESAGRELRAGLSAQVIVPTRKRTALQYLLEPLDQTLWRSLREE
ncbi:MAG TPA: HlyD family efflux transporter periplasmic adaptor subunit [Vitreimonas sp.]|uniref:HlyD family efflux transporter periplasmic adaptor subunit n=1 Tax=Vitreimonas sp. TaxID=3069702 RepID=UPI002D446306|nr:HlyD family efflux transporter periplasmic adaptor subunit [Vitreimonas sp.]HYD87553.1 HlyD family efflux transporter periplasmic adaptor subunit [Vitreimonas sp.]